MAGRIRYRRTSVRTLLGITKEEKRIKRELGITALLKPFRWWGNEKRHVKRELGYYSPTAQLARHVLPHRLGKLLLLVALVLGLPFALGWLLARGQALPAALSAPDGSVTQPADDAGAERQADSAAARPRPIVQTFESEPAVAVNPVSQSSPPTLAALPAESRQTYSMGQMITPRIVIDEEEEDRLGISAP